MKPIAVKPPAIAQRPAPPRVGNPTAMTFSATPTGSASRFWLRVFFFLARRARWLLRALRPLGVWGAVRCSAKIRRGTYANARRILGPHLTDKQCDRFARGVVRHFYDFVTDVGRSSRMTAAQLRAAIESIDGHEAYVAHRKNGNGAIIVTAHMGSFEVGLAALLGVEQHIHVVFKRDPMDGFESIRSALRAKLGVHEAPIDDGWDTWMRLRDALARNHVVIMQGDRAMPGQKAQSVPMLGGHVSLPLGPVKLAQISGSPIVPVLTVRTPTGGCRVCAEQPIIVDPSAPLIDGVCPALAQLGKVIEKYVTAYPEQWLVLDPAFIEDAMHPQETRNP